MHYGRHASTRRVSVVGTDKSLLYWHTRICHNVDALFVLVHDSIYLRSRRASVNQIHVKHVVVDEYGTYCVALVRLVDKLGRYDKDLHKHMQRGRGCGQCQ